MQDTLCLTPRLHWKVTLCLVTSNGKGHGTGKLPEEFSIEFSQKVIATLVDRTKKLFNVHGHRGDFG